MPDDDSPLESTASLLRRARAGEAIARNQLFLRYGAILRRWAHGRFRQCMGSDKDTQDFVQETLLRALKKLDSFEPRREGAFLAYLREILRNLALDEGRRLERRPPSAALSEWIRDKGPSPEGLTIREEIFEIYEKALRHFKPRTREALILKLEFGFNYRQIAEALNQRPEETMHVRTENAVRVLIKRAVVRLAEHMHSLLEEE